MSLDPSIKRNWIEIQRKSPRPVNAIGIPIDPQDEQAMAVWRREGLDRYLAGDEPAREES